METETAALTTYLGRRLQELNAEGVDFEAICALEDKLKSAFNNLKYIRRCYYKPATHQHPFE